MSEGFRAKMEERIFLKRMRHLLCCLALAAPLTVARAADAPASPPHNELLGQIVNIDRPDFKARGKITLHRLQPLAGQLLLSEAKGDPEWIIKTIHPWNPRLAALLRQMQIQELTLEEADLLLDGPSIVLKLLKAGIPEGELRQIDYQQGEGGGWRVTTGSLRLDRLPQGLNGLVLPLSSGGLGYERLEAEGDRDKGSGWLTGLALQGWRVARLEGAGEVTGRNSQGYPQRGAFTWKASGTRAPGLAGAAGRVPELAELLRFAGRNPASAEPVELGKVTMRVESDGSGNFLIRNLVVDAPWIHLRGEGVLEIRNGEDKNRLRLNLLAKTPQGREKRFKATIPLSALVRS
ncbi:MAG: hypothetical protein HQL95_14555 [Magnetococcales bacterium]|nr:hypothetical protein [Magnetococcales bacterium]